MPIKKQDIQWWLQEASLHPESSSSIIEALTARLEELDRQNEELRGEMIRLRRSLSNRDKDWEIQRLQQRADVLERQLAQSRHIKRPDVILFSRSGAGARIPLESLIESAQTRAVTRVAPLLVQRPCLVTSDQEAELILLTHLGKGLILPVAQIPLQTDLVLVTLCPTPNVQLETGDSIVALGVAGQLRRRRWVTLVTRRGFVRQTMMIVAERQIAQSESMITSPLADDEPLLVLSSDATDEILLFTRHGKWTRFPGNAISGQGVVGIELQANDEVIAAASLDKDREFLILTSDGFAFRRSSERLQPRSRPGGMGKTMLRRHGVLEVVPSGAVGEIVWFTDRNGLRLSQLSDQFLEGDDDRISLVDLFEEQTLAAVVIPTQE